MSVFDIVHYLNDAHRGKHIWKKMIHQTGADKKTQIIVMPEHNNELNLTAFRYMKYMMQRRNSDNVIILTDDQWVIDNYLIVKELSPVLVKCTYNQILYLQKYYECFVFSRNISIISLNKPSGNTVYKFIGKNGITYDDVVCLCIYNLRCKPDVSAKS